MLAQGFVSFLLWMVYGVIQMRRSSAIRSSLSRFSRARRVILGSVSLLGGIALLFGGFIGVQWLGGFSGNGMTIPAWVFVTILGLAFVHLQTIGTALLVSLSFDAVTRRASPASTSTESPRETSL